MFDKVGFLRALKSDADFRSDVAELLKEDLLDSLSIGSVVDELSFDPKDLEISYELRTTDELFVWKESEILESIGKTLSNKHPNIKLTNKQLKKLYDLVNFTYKKNHGVHEEMSINFLSGVNGIIEYVFYKIFGIIKGEPNVGEEGFDIECRIKKFEELQH